MLMSAANIDLDNPEFQNVWNLVNHTSRSIFMTGKAGTGKSTFLRYITENTKKSYVVLAPTGIAAVNVGGVTMHSFFRIPFKPLLPDDPDLAPDRLRQRLKYTREHRKLLRKLDLIIIDEISMVRADIIDFMDRILRVYCRRRHEPFGGKQLLLVGDIFQLDPVVTGDMRDILSRYYPNPFFFSARVFKEHTLIPIELRKIYRQNDRSFISMLDRIRVGAPTLADLDALRARLDQNADSSGDDFVMTLAARRDMVDSINDSHLSRLPSATITYMGEIVDNFPDNSLPAPKELTIKVGAQIVFVRNDRDKRWVNGTLGRVYSATPDRLEVELEDGTRHVITPEQWENIEYGYDEETHRVSEKVIGIYRQYPIRLAWALTVHKSQGLTFNKVIIDLGRGAFSSGQSYVALSRCTSIEGLTLKSPLTARDIFVNPAIVGFTHLFNNPSIVQEAIEGAKADEMLRQAAVEFDKGNTSVAIDLLFGAMQRKNITSRPEVVRLIKRKLTVIDSLRKEVARLKSAASEGARQFDSLAEEYVELGAECMEGGELEAAIANYKKAISISPRKVEAIFGIATAYSQSGDIDSALANFRRILEIEPKHFQAAINLADLYLQQGDIYEALNGYLVALGIDKKKPAVYTRLADLYEQMGDDAEAERYRRAAKTLKPPRKKK